MFIEIHTALSISVVVASVTLCSVDPAFDPACEVLKSAPRF